MNTQQPLKDLIKSKTGHEVHFLGSIKDINDNTILVKYVPKTTPQTGENLQITLSIEEVDRAYLEEEQK